MENDTVDTSPPKAKMAKVLPSRDPNVARRLEAKLCMIAGSGDAPSRVWGRLGPMLDKAKAAGADVPTVVSEWIAANPKG